MFTIIQTMHTYADGLPHPRSENSVRCSSCRLSLDVTHKNRGIIYRQNEKNTVALTYATGVNQNEKTEIRLK
jgi:hypothetical protein